MEDTSFLGEIESITCKEKKIVIQGWGLRLDSEIDNVRIFLQDTQKKRGAILEIENIEYNEPALFYGVDSTFCIGFSAEINRNKLQENACYEIMLIVDFVDENKSVSKKYSTQQYLYDCNLYQYNPIDFWKPETEDTLIQEAVDKGELLYCDLDNKMWVYRYNNRVQLISATSNLNMTDETKDVPLIVYMYEEGKTESVYTANYITEEDYVKMQNNSYYTYEFDLSQRENISHLVTGIWDDRLGWTYKCVIEMHPDF